jgi:hypothetical protein
LCSFFFFRLSSPHTDQENHLLRSFQHKLNAVQQELREAKKQNESGSQEWVAIIKRKEEERDFYQKDRDRLKQEKEVFYTENKKLKRQLKTQEEDRDFLIKQLVSVKKENSRLKHAIEQVCLSACLSVWLCAVSVPFFRFALVSLAFSSSLPLPLLLSSFLCLFVFSSGGNDHR